MYCHINQQISFAKTRYCYVKSGSSAEAQLGAMILTCHKQNLNQGFLEMSKILISTTFTFFNEGGEFLVNLFDSNYYDLYLYPNKYKCQSM